MRAWISSYALPILIVVAVIVGAAFLLYIGLVGISVSF